MLLVQFCCSLVVLVMKIASPVVMVQVGYILQYGCFVIYMILSASISCK